jgi:hypothetical protein
MECEMATLTLKNPPKPKVPEPAASIVVVVETKTQPTIPERSESPMQVVDRHLNFSIRKANTFVRGADKRLVQTGSLFYVVNDEVLAAADLAVAIVGSPFPTLTEARKSIGREVPDHNTEKTPPKSAYAAFSGPKHARGGGTKK